MSQKDENLFSRLTKLFRSGPVVKRKVKGYTSPTASSSYELFRRNVSDIYSTTVSAYGSFDRMARYSDFSEMEACVSGDTLIAVPDGYITIEELSKKYGKDETFVVYSYDHSKSQIIPAIAKQARKTTTALALKVTFDCGKTLIATPDHRVMKRDGTYCEVQDLRPGDSMMPFYRKDSQVDGRRFVYTMNREQSSFEEGWEAEHKLIAEWVSGRRLSEGERIHHINLDHRDNSPENLYIVNDEDILDKKKLLNENEKWVNQFKERHSKFMKENDPAARKDITFELILNMCDLYGYNIRDITRRLDCDKNLITQRLNARGFLNFEQFSKAYNHSCKNIDVESLDQTYNSNATFQMVCDAFNSGMTAEDVANNLRTTSQVIMSGLHKHGYDNWKQFSESFANHKIASVEQYGVIDLYDLTVDGYKNYATDSILIHNTPEVASALDIYSEEATSQDEAGKVLHIYSDNRAIRELLEDLFYDTLNIDFNLPMWTRNLCKYGDFFSFLDIDPKYGVINALPIPISEIEREEGYDPKDPMAVRFRWITKGNRILENWQVVHFRLLGNDAFLPYGASVLDSARRIWRQLILSEDAMLLYRVVRAPERRIFYIDVGNVPPEEVENYMQQIQTSLKRNMVIDKATGRVDLRFNPMSSLDDYYIPVRGGESGTKIDTLAGGQNTSAVEDVQYIQKKLFAALKIPKAYIGYDEEIGSKATLAQEDIRFSRTISRIQKVILSELNKIAMIHLYSHGFTDESILNFKLMLNNPSSVAQMQKLELIKTKFDIASSAPEGAVDRSWIRKNVLGLTDEDIEKVKQGRKNDKIEDAEIEAAQPEGSEEEGGEEQQGLGGADDLFGGGEEGAGLEQPTEEPAGEAPEELNAGYIPTGRSSDGLPVKLSNEVRGIWRKQGQKQNSELNKKRTKTSRHRNHMPDFLATTTTGLSDPYGDTFTNVMNEYEDTPISLSDAMLDEKSVTSKPRMTGEMENIFKTLSGKIGIKSSSRILSETFDDYSDESEE